MDPPEWGIQFHWVPPKAFTFSLLPQNFLSIVGDFSCNTAIRIKMHQKIYFKKKVPGMWFGLWVFRKVLFMYLKLDHLMVTGNIESINKGTNQMVELKKQWGVALTLSHNQVVSRAQCCTRTTL